jgi:hypothetical protein
MNADPNVVIPSPALPQPNAYDFFRAAGSAVKDSDKIGFALAPKTASLPKDRPPYTRAEREALVRENADALRVLRAGFAFPYREAYIHSYNTVFPYYAEFRNLARLLALEAQTEAARGDWSGAVNSRLDAMQLGTEIPHGGALIGKLVGIACQAIGRGETWDAVSHLNAAQSRSAAQRLEAILARRVPFADTMREEKWLGQGSLMEQFRKPDWRGEILSLAFANAGEGGPPEEAAVSVRNFELRTRLLFDSKRKIMDSYTRYMDAAIANTELPYAVRPPEPPLPGDIVNSLLLPTYTRARFADVCDETQNALLTATFALHAYRLEHGVYPDTLSTLVPRYLRQIPSDPFAMRGLLRYRRDGQNYLLYSFGPDGKDDGGRPADARRHAQDGRQTGDKLWKSLPESLRAQRYQVREASDGDIVAGVNRQTGS